MPRKTAFSTVEVAVLSDAVEIARDMLTTKYKADLPRIDILAKLIVEIGERRIRAGASLTAEADAQSIASFATAILTKSDPR